LPIASFAKGEFKPRGRNVFPLSYGRIALPQRGRLDASRASGFRKAILEHHSNLERGDRLAADLALNLGPVAFRLVVAGVADLVLKGAIVREQQQAFAVTI
jgi:hypothetical protein